MEATSDGDRPWQSYHTVYTNAKAGMEGVDKEKVQKIIYELSKGSKYFENEKRKEAIIKQKIDNLRTHHAKLTEKEISHFQMIADNRILELEASRDLSKIWLHIDMDAFYAAVETLENPSLKGKPLAVGSMSMICTASYEARKYGVRAAMPGFIARKLCPDLIFVPTNFEKYTYYSELTRNVFSKYDPDFIATSLDEAYLNITDICSQRGIGCEEVAVELRNTIFQETRLTCSVGVAPNRMLAKVCSDINKPNGQFILPNDYNAVMTFISSLPIRKVGGIGKVTEQILRDVLGINTCADILHKGAVLYALFHQCSTDFFLSVGLGLGGTDTPQQKMRKSISNEKTFSATNDESIIFQKLADIAETLSKDMQKECLLGRTLTLKLKTASFEVRTRATSLQKFVNSKEDILIYASKLLRAELPISARLMGLRMSHFHDDKHSPLDPMQKTLTSFLTIGNVAPIADKSTGFDTSDIQLMYNTKSDISVDDESTFLSDVSSFSYESCDFLETNQLSVPDYVAVSYGNGAESLNECPKTQNKFESAEKISDVSNLFDRKRVAASSSQILEPYWVDDYICSACGIEVPASFTEERREHLDYHLADMLQKEECRSLLQSFPHKESARKKRKSSGNQGKYIPIDSFFVKEDKSL
uniref:DNA polymerase kappa n=2 Tax=Musa acuminata subsp. malaccensis TaxID=214687 RepID=A0A804IZR5_MUSAM|nr:PREDICTED: DNA polymerase kappa isoform X2 [Musa acuminata subsp. malaccensis]